MKSRNDALDSCESQDADSLLKDPHAKSPPFKNPKAISEPYGLTDNAPKALNDTLPDRAAAALQRAPQRSSK